MTFSLWMSGTLSALMLGMGIAGYPHEKQMPFDVAMVFIIVGGLVLAMATVVAGGRGSQWDRRRGGHD